MANFVRAGLTGVRRLVVAATRGDAARSGSSLAGRSAEQHIRSSVLAANTARKQEPEQQGRVRTLPHQPHRTAKPLQNIQNRVGSAAFSKRAMSSRANRERAFIELCQRIILVISSSVVRSIYVAEKQSMPNFGLAVSTFH